MMGQASAEWSSIQFETGGQLTKRLKCIKKAMDEFCDRWLKEVFPTLLKKNKMDQVKKRHSGR
jgi:hypothetical protein